LEGRGCLLQQFKSFWARGPSNIAISVMPLRIRSLQCESPCCLTYGLMMNSFQ
jgi:hypothetical protein